MKVLLIDTSPESRQIVRTRLLEALRRAGLKHAQVFDGDFELLSDQVGTEPPRLAFLGPGCYQELEDSIAKLRSLHPSVPLAVVLANEIYTAEAVELRRLLPVRFMPIADIDQMALFVLDYDQPPTGSPSAANRGVVTLVQFKGGVGATTLAAGLAACWARHDVTTAIVDLDDLNPHLTDWSRVGIAPRKLAADFLRAGVVPQHRLNELAAPVAEYNGRLFIVPQPENYSEGFHFKADVLDNAPSSAEYLRSLISALQEEYEAVIIDAGRSWGVAGFAALPLSQHVILVVDSNWTTLRRSLDNFARLCRESDDTAEFDLTRWSVVLNGYADKQLSPHEVSQELEELDLFPETIDLFTIPFSQQGQHWGNAGETLYELADPRVKSIVEEIAFHCIPFRRQHETSEGVLYRKLKKHFTRRGTSA